MAHKKAEPSLTTGAPCSTAMDFGYLSPGSKGFI